MLTRGPLPGCSALTPPSSLLRPSSALPPAPSPAPRPREKGTAGGGCQTRTGCARDALREGFRVRLHLLASLVQAVKPFMTGLIQNPRGHKLYMVD